MAKIKREARTGRILITLGLIFKIIQIIGSAFSVDALSGTVSTVITTCLLVGGLAVLAVEKISVRSALSIIAIVGIMGGILPGNDYKYSLIYLMITFVAYAAILISTGRPARITSGVFVIILSILLMLHSLSVLSLPAPLAVILLILTYAVMGIGLYI